MARRQLEVMKGDKLVGLFATQGEASKAIGVASSTISHKLRTQESCKGYMFRWVDTDANILMFYYDDHRHTAKNIEEASRLSSISVEDIQDAMRNDKEVHGWYFDEEAK